MADEVQLQESPGGTIVVSPPHGNGVTSAAEAPLHAAAASLGVDPAAIEQALTTRSATVRTPSGIITTVSPIASMDEAMMRHSDLLVEVYNRTLRFIEERVGLHFAPIGSAKHDRADPSSTITMIHAPAFAVRQSFALLARRPLARVALQLDGRICR